MSVQITIIGLGKIGASIGLALDGHENLIRVGHDKDMSSARKAQKMGAIDKVHRNLPNSVIDSDIVILSLPFSEIYETMGYIKEDLKDDAVILDTAPSKMATSERMQEILPAGRAYIGLAPVINPFYLDERESGIDAARADLFSKGVTLIATPPTASGAAIQLSSDLVQLFGSNPLFADIAEVDGVMATAYLLPQLVSVALLNATVDAPGWEETRKCAGQEYADTTVSSPIQEGVASLSSASLLNASNVSRVLGEMIASLQNIQKSIANGDEDALNKILSRAEKGRENWLIERRSAEWLLRGEKADAVKLGGIAERFFGFKERK